VEKSRSTLSGCRDAWRSLHSVASFTLDRNAMSLLPRLFTAALLGAAAAAHAATPVYLTLDHSSAPVMEAATAKAVWKAHLDDKLVKRLAKLYPVGKWAFISQVEGGYNADKLCVVTARVVLVPRAGKSAVFTPKEKATAFDAKPNLDAAQCKALGKDKLDEAINAVVSSLVAQ
jgi:hypothetical protein